MVESAAGAINQSLMLVVCHPEFSADHSNRLAVEDLLQQSILRQGETVLQAKREARSLWFHNEKTSLVNGQGLREIVQESAFLELVLFIRQRVNEKRNYLFIFIRVFDQVFFNYLE
ncbi:hypothetical protein TNCV_4824901 [Trichonephila clavipes]|uniref:Uncharacterized protein n=1 Tax=Trichonephila clavipes TaxID=2585209 RepID=A0A8X6V710_TRICX|nr:hypothetical protein TNCV_4824901 [Trichonephila clavipes]